MNIYDLSLYIIQNFSQSGKITHLKLQKLLFYVKAWTLVEGSRLIVEPFYKWEYGPVNKEIWQQYKHYKSEFIFPDTNKFLEPSPREKKLIDFIVENYIEFHPYTLSAMTHSESPWKDTPRNQLIPDELIKEYYSKFLFAKNFPIEENKPFYPVMSDMEYAFIFDMAESDALNSMVFPSYKIYKEWKREAEKTFQKRKKYWLKKLAKI